MAGEKIEHITTDDGIVYFLTDVRDCYRVRMEGGQPVIECVKMNVPQGCWPEVVNNPFR